MESPINEYIIVIEKKKKKDKYYTIISVHAEQSFDKIQHLYMKKKILNKLEAVENFLNAINNLLNPAVNIIFNNKALDIFLQKPGTR